MISGVFVDRPRLAIVIAILTTIAGLIAMLRIPVAQFPDIVPPQVQVTTRYPGAPASVVEATVAQPLEAQVNGADRMIYMKSNSGNDGSYGLTVSFELGTNPDINTVNVNNRVQAALSRLPQDVQRQGVTVQKRSSAILEFLAFYSEGGKQKPLYISNFVTINVLDTLARVPGVGSATVFGALDYSMRIWFDVARLTQLGLSPSDIANAIQSQNVQAPVGRVGARPTAEDTQFQLNVQTQGRLTTPEQFGDILIRANPDGSLLHLRDVARVELGAATQDTSSELNGNPAVTVGVYLAPGANAVQTAARVNQALATLSQRYPEGLEEPRLLRQHHLRLGHDQGGPQDARRGVRARCARRVPVPRQPARDHYPDCRGAGEPDRHLRRAARRGLLREHDLAAGARARHRHRGR